MKFLTFVALSLGGIFSQAVPELPWRAHKNKSTRGAHRDFVFLGNDRPVLFRLHMGVSGGSPRGPWEKYMGKLFAYADRNGDGTLDKDEAKLLLRGTSLLNHLRGSLGGVSTRQRITLNDADSNKDGKVTLKEVQAYYDAQGFPAFRFISSDSSTQAKRYTDVLYKRLDTNKDDLLSPEELARGPEALRRLDDNENELITTNELTSTRPNYGFAVAPSAVAGGGAAPSSSRPIWLPVRKGKDTTSILRQILQRYDSNKDGKLTRKELRLEKARFARLDANGDRHLQEKELTGLLQGTPDMELRMRLGKDLRTGSLTTWALQQMGLMRRIRRLEVVRAGHNKPLPEVKQDALQLALGDTDLEIQTWSNTSPSNFMNARRFYIQRFQNAVGKKKFLTKKQAMRSYYMRGLFELADRNADGKLYLDELQTYLAVQNQGSNCMLVLRVSDRGQNLFSVLDRDHNGSLSIRELREGWKQLRPGKKDTRGFARTEIRRNLRVILGQARADYRPIIRNRPRPVSKPKWFAQMDRNNDGDVSQREFLGSLEDFRRLDKDGDGLISAAEGQRARAASGVSRR